MKFAPTGGFVGLNCGVDSDPGGDHINAPTSVLDTNHKVRPPRSRASMTTLLFPVWCIAVRRLIWSSLRFFGRMRPPKQAPSTSPTPEAVQPKAALEAQGITLVSDDETLEIAYKSKGERIGGLVAKNLASGTRCQSHFRPFTGLQNVC